MYKAKLSFQMCGALCGSVVHFVILPATYCHKAHKSACVPPPTTCAEAIDACAIASASEHGGARLWPPETGRQANHLPACLYSFHYFVANRIIDRNFRVFRSMNTIYI